MWLTRRVGRDKTWNHQKTGGTRGRVWNGRRSAGLAVDCQWYNERFDSGEVTRNCFSSREIRSLSHLTLAFSGLEIYNFAIHVLSYRQLVTVNSRISYYFNLVQIRHIYILIYEDYSPQNIQNHSNHPKIPWLPPGVTFSIGRPFNIRYYRFVF
jgi:hypothetical protein